jgi:hypothetical protein
MPPAGRPLERLDEGGEVGESVTDVVGLGHCGDDGTFTRPTEFDDTFRIGLTETPFVLHDDTLSDDLAGVITDVRLVQRMSHVAASSGEVGEVLHRHEVEVVVEVASVVTARHRKQLGNGPQSIEGVTKCLLRLGCDTLSPSGRNDLAKHLRTSQQRSVGHISSGRLAPRLLCVEHTRLEFRPDVRAVNLTLAGAWPVAETLGGSLGSLGKMVKAVTTLPRTGEPVRSSIASSRSVRGVSGRLHIVIDPYRREKPAWISRTPRQPGPQRDG